jgi:pyridoxal phosphate enzyme (YggS family)
MYGTTLEERLARVRDAVAAAAERVGRASSSVLLVAVTKGHPLAAVEAALAAKLTDLGENRVEELELKASQIDDPRTRWHMIGHLQSRKARRACAVADVVHSVDSIKLARRLGAAATERDGELAVLIQANVSGEGTKSGFGAEAVVEAAAEIREIPGLRVDGLMTMAPFTASERDLRTTFATLRSCLERVRELGSDVGSELSMGMSNDFEIAIEEGSTMVRLGTALFGKRPT